MTFSTITISTTAATSTYTTTTTSNTATTIGTLTRFTSRAALAPSVEVEESSRGFVVFVLPWVDEGPLEVCPLM